MTWWYSKLLYKVCLHKSIYRGCWIQIPSAIIPIRNRDSASTIQTSISLEQNTEFNLRLAFSGLLRSKCNLVEYAAGTATGKLARRQPTRANNDHYCQRYEQERKEGIDVFQTRDLHNLRSKVDCTGRHIDYRIDRAHLVTRRGTRVSLRRCVAKSFRGWNVIEDDDYDSDLPVVATLSAAFQTQVSCLSHDRERFRSSTPSRAKLRKCRF